jgi:flagellar biosynthesis protein FlhA
MRLSNIGVPVVIVAILLIIIIPIPTQMLDVLLAINISVALVILLNSIYAKDALQMSIFPSLLLITTIFRLSLNISATKLVLGTGEAGAVIDAFGRFVTRDNTIVGIIVYLIIMVVQFLVITKGSERVAEVAARFTLDAMPGKQMAIDADLNSGMINETEARERRKNIQREADFYGAMDGASKFVKGDAIAGIVITFINIIGGFIIGVMQRGEPMSQAFNTYTVLTIGDGLVSQIPALLISTGTGFIVTRAASESNLSEDVVKQILQNPKVMLISAIMCLMLAGFGLPAIPFITIAAILLIASFQVNRQAKAKEKAQEVKVQETEVEEIRRPENVVTLLQVDPIELEFGYGIIPLADVNQGGDLLDRVVMIRRQLALELGVIVPMIRLRDNIQLSSNQYIIKIKGAQIAQGELMFEHFLAMNPGGAEEEIEGVETIEPAFGLPAKWITKMQRERAEMLGYTVVDPPSIIATHLTEVIKKHAHELLGRQDVQTLIDNVKATYPAIVDELIPKVLNLGEIQKVLANLLRENISVRDMVTILETLGDFAPITRDTDMLTEYVRQGLARSISRRFIEDTKTNVITIDPELEQQIVESIQRSDFGSYITLEPTITQKIINNLFKLIQNTMSAGQPPIVLASPNVRPYFKKLTEQSFPDLVVLSYNEVDPSIEIQSIGMVTI